jgi:tRNA-dihydrouridine synthase
MAELSHRPLRELIEEFGGCSEYYTEMISAGAFIAAGPFETWYADAGPCPAKVVYQLIGHDDVALARAAGILDNRDCLGIDINMGCSAPAITRTGAGVRWMADLDKAGTMIALVRKAVKRRLSVKLRTGLADNFEYLLDFCRRLEAEGVERITLHPRTAKEKFKRTARWEYVAALRRELGIPVAGNGDIASAAEMLRRALPQGGAGGACPVMIGRLAVRQPWVFARAQAEAGEQDRQTGVGGPPANARFPADLEKTGLRFLELLTRHQPREFYLSRARRFFGYFCGNLKWANYVKTLLNRETDLAGLERAWQGYFREHPEEKFETIPAR